MPRQFKHGDDVVVLAHNYQIPEVQDFADFIGDSLYLAKLAQDLDVKTIVFCGVDFMAESAKILSPEKRVIHPNEESVCPMAGMVDIEGLEMMKEEHPHAAVVSYVNTTAETKSISDYCCTSSNAVKILRNIPEKEVIFVPDMNLGLYASRFVKDKKVHLWPGYCPTHNNMITLSTVTEEKQKHPEALLLVHPECKPEVIDEADYVGSTEGIRKFAHDSQDDEFIIGTEKDMCYRLRKEMPEKTFHAMESAICPNMKKINLEMVKTSMEEGLPEIILSQDVMEKARVPLERMVEFGRGD